MMKRYDNEDGDMICCDVGGEWVKYEDAKKVHHENFRVEIANGELKAENTRLKELNREMATALKGISYCEIPGDHQKIIIELLAKAGEEGE